MIVGSVRRLLALLSAIIFIDGLFYSALSPLLPGFQDDLGLSESQAGVLVAMYPVGMMLAAFPVAGLLARIGVKTTTIAGLVVVAVTLVVFALADDYTMLLITRLLQGAGAAGIWGGALVWIIEAGPADRRGERFGVLAAAMAGGQIAGPLVGGLAAGVGREPTFVVVAVIAGLLSLAALRFPGPPAVERGPLEVRAAVGSRPVRVAVLLVGLPWILLGALSVLGPLQLDDLGASAGQIAVTFGISAVIGMLGQPFIGRWSDRRGRLLPIRLGLAAAAAALVAVAWMDHRWMAAVLIVVALLAVEVFWVPVMALLSDACELAGVGQILAVTIMGFAGTPAFIVGSAGGGALAQAAGFSWTYVVVAVVMALVLVALARQGEARDAAAVGPTTSQAMGNP